ncbi:MAG TPA: hypothetical protein VHR41_06765 [Gemmatimonadales bacterium]|nr:hypothetical protein [Gemmatimonadales bacterium]
MLQPGGDADLAGEALRAEGGGELRPQDLHGHLTLVLGVVGQKDRGHASLPELALHEIGRAQRLLEPVA